MDIELVSSFLMVTSVHVDGVWNSEKKNEHADERHLRLDSYVEQEVCL